MRTFAINGLAVCLAEAGRIRSVSAAEFWEAPPSMGVLGYCRGLVIEFDNMSLCVSSTMTEQNIGTLSVGNEPLDGLIFGWALDCVNKERQSDAISKLLSGYSISNLKALDRDLSGYQVSIIYECGAEGGGDRFLISISMIGGDGVDFVAESEGRLSCRQATFVSRQLR